MLIIELYFYDILWDVFNNDYIGFDEAT
jgi:hypothetical protein